jgi:hypothetical protein
MSLPDRIPREAEPWEGILSMYLLPMVPEVEVRTLGAGIEASSDPRS